MSSPIIVPPNTATTSAPAMTPTVILTAVSPSRMANGFRTSQVVGSTIVNEAKDTIGTIDDLIVSPTEKSAFAVLSIGGFLGIGAKYVVVPFSSLEAQSDNTHLLLRGATEASLKNLPEYKYNA
ncbi:MAG: PRC-barrel domain-containing protein [Elstera sp.]